MATKAIQYFSDEYLKKCKGMTAEQIVQFLEDFRLLHADSAMDFFKEKADKIEKMNFS